jgi:predicted ester cyclase
VSVGCQHDEEDPPDLEASMANDHATIARDALEQVCSGKRLADVGDYYSPEFVDHVNASEYHGLEGARQSVGLYQELFEDLRFEVLQQVTEGDTVASRWQLHGTHRGRHVRLTGIVISRIEDGRIVEDFAATDTLQLARQLGVWRTVLLLATRPSLLRH